MLTRPLAKLMIIGRPDDVHVYKSLSPLVLEKGGGGGRGGGSAAPYNPPSVSDSVQWVHSSPVAHAGRQWSV